MAAVLEEGLDDSRASFAGEVAARLERLPLSSWQVRARIIIGTATFFDAFDALAIAYILPVLAPLWHLSPQQVGFLISAGFFGQLSARCFSAGSPNAMGACGRCSARLRLSGC